MRHFAVRAAWSAVGLAFLLVAGAGPAGACEGAKSGVQKAKASSGCSSMMKASATPGCAGMKGASAASAGCLHATGEKAKSGQAILCPTSGKVLLTVQVVETKSGFRLYALGCKETGRGFLEKSARILDAEHHVKSRIGEATDGLYMDVDGKTAKKMVHSWQETAKKGEGGCLLATPEGECLLDAVSLTAAVG
ncbi:MAG: hypothetical protein FJY73_02405 [Candidatus Eisenbacteria bacterium]|nr:hypothetical protein [Candidatus Eisenbacteria bacterium]